MLTGSLKQEPPDEVFDFALLKYKDNNVHDLAAFNAAVTADMRTICAKYGGPQQFLEGRYPDDHSCIAFAQYLDNALPLRPDVTYIHDDILKDPHSWPESAHVRLSKLGFAAALSTKPPPFTHLCEDLTQQFLAHGFVSTGLH